MLASKQVAFGANATIYLERSRRTSKWHFLGKVGIQTGPKAFSDCSLHCQIWILGDDVAAKTENLKTCSILGGRSDPRDALSFLTVDTRWQLDNNTRRY